MRWKPAKERFKSRITVDQNTGCWLWDRSDNRQGYGRFHFNGKKYLAHRAAYILFKGDIPDGLCLDHLCRNPLCVNPCHLEPVTMRENVMRGLLPKRSRERKGKPNLNSHHRAKMNCPKGHPYSGENLYIRSNGRRECRECMRMRGRVGAYDPHGVKHIKTHCAQGHAFTKDNTIIGSSGRRVCRTCRNDILRRRRLKKNARKAS